MRKRAARREELGLTRAEYAALRQLTTPAKIQDFVNALPINLERGGDTCLSVRRVLALRRAHCIEAAMLAACALWMHGEPPLLMDLKARRDFDHVVALFRRGRRWGAIAKSNNVYLRYRDPVYRTLRELAMSYFHEYANKRGQKTLRSYSRPFDLRTLDPDIWVTNEKNCWEVAEKLDEARHYSLVTSRQARKLRRWDAVERRVSRVLQPRSKSAKR